MRYDVRCLKCKQSFEIDKPMTAEFPRCSCGGGLRRLFNSAPPIRFNAHGFTLSETRFAKMIGSDEYARFEAQKKDAERRAASGQLTAYEKALETI